MHDCQSGLLGGTVCSRIDHGERVQQGAGCGKTHLGTASPPKLALDKSFHYSTFGRLYTQSYTGVGCAYHQCATLVYVQRQNCRSCARSLLLHTSSSSSSFFFFSPHQLRCWSKICCSGGISMMLRSHTKVLATWHQESRVRPCIVAESKAFIMQTQATTLATSSRLSAAQQVPCAR